MTKLVRTKTGTVVRLAGPMTAVIEVTVSKQHPKYFKRYKQSKRFHAHVLSGQVQVGQLVTIVETRPYSATKRWRVSEVLNATVPEKETA